MFGYEYTEKYKNLVAEGQNSQVALKTCLEAYIQSRSQWLADKASTSFLFRSKYLFDEAQTKQNISLASQLLAAENPSDMFAQLKDIVTSKSLGTGALTHLLTHVFHNAYHDAAHLFSLLKVELKAAEDEKLWMAVEKNNFYKRVQWLQWGMAHLVDIFKPVSIESLVQTMHEYDKCNKKTDSFSQRWVIPLRFSDKRWGLIISERATNNLFISGECCSADLREISKAFSPLAIHNIKSDPQREVGIEQSGEALLSSCVRLIINKPVPAGPRDSGHARASV